ncbi:MAG TPA: M56 family metallopeptidase [Pyrinomonadaceae bacterium]|jgi:beta-lactamase regulating signal transducer with metallopeptidase domain
MIRTFSEAAIAIGSSAELLILVKATVAVVLGLAAARIAKSTRASVRHLVLSSTFGVLLALPVAAALVPAVLFRIPATQPNSSVTTPATVQLRGVSTTPASGIVDTPQATSAQRISISRTIIFRAAWAIGAAVFFAPFATALWRLRRARRSAVPWLEARATLHALADEAGVHRAVEVLLHDRILAPVTCGLLHPAILLPADAREWSEVDVRRAFVHELEHIRRGDWAVHVLARSVCALYWFHPMVWAAWRQLCLEAERACDDAVLLGAERADYAEQLVTLARRLSHTLAPPALSMANRSDLSRRISAILDSNQSRGRTGLLFTAAALMVAAVVVLGIAPVRAVGTPASNNASISQQQNATTDSSRLNRALLEAAEEGDISEITKLLEAGADVNAAIDGDGSPLIVAAREGHIAAVQLLLDKGANPDRGVPGDGSAIIMAAREGHEDVVKLLLDRGAHIDQVVAGDENALIQASGEGQLSVVKLLVSRGADVNARVWVDHITQQAKGEWRTPLNMARKGGHNAVVDFLISAGARE